MIAERELNSLYHDKWRKLSKSGSDLNLDQPMPSFEHAKFRALSELFSYSSLQLIKPQL